MRGLFDYDNGKKELERLTALTEASNLWDNASEAQKILKAQSRLQSSLGNFDKTKQKFEQNLEMLAMAFEEGESNLISECESNIEEMAVLMDKLEFECLFSGEHDASNCYVEINAGAGGTESHDWASMMMRMYLRFAEKIGAKAEIVYLLDGEEAGIKNCTLRIAGSYAYGWFKTETGVHRLVRISPYNAAGKRMTSFGGVWVYPEIDDNIDIEVLEKDLRIDTYRASGAGGQHVNTTDSAVRITHVPTNVVVQCQSDRSQHKNKATAMKMLKAKLYEEEMKKRRNVIDKANESKTEIGWGHQIRSYVLQPYQMIKDLRTGYETSDVGAVLDGELQNFVEKALALNINKENVS